MPERTSELEMRARRAKKLLWVGAVALAAAALAVVLWIRHFHDYTPVEVALDVHAALAARNEARPVDRFMELRYGPMTESGNRQKAFLDFFNVGHIEGLQVLVKRMPASHRELGIANMARWVSDYRRTLSPQEKASLRDYFQTESGRGTLERATAKYLSQDVYYRDATAQVIEELMATLVAIQKQ